jgi:hypothetical protein
MPASTIAYSEGFKGFPSFYDFLPDYMIGMNQHFYTFKGGNLYRHNVNSIRNEFYGVSTPSIMKTVFNEQVLDNKLFKTINIEGTHAWDVDLETDHTDIDGQILDSYFEKKEGSFFSFIRVTNNVEQEQTWELRTLSGIATSTNVLNYAIGPDQFASVDFAVSINLGSQMSIGDYLFYAQAPTYTPILVGKITQINVDLTVPTNNIVAQNGGAPIPSNTEYFLYMKDPAAEDFGVLGHYMVADMSNDTYDEYVELFALRSEIMKSFP